MFTLNFNIKTEQIKRNAMFAIYKLSELQKKYSFEFSVIKNTKIETIILDVKKTDVFQQMKNMKNEYKNIFIKNRKAAKQEWNYLQQTNSFLQGYFLNHESTIIKIQIDFKLVDEIKQSRILKETIIKKWSEPEYCKFLVHFPFEQSYNELEEKIETIIINYSKEEIKEEIKPEIQETKQEKEISSTSPKTKTDAANEIVETVSIENKNLIQETQEKYIDLDQRIFEANKSLNLLFRTIVESDYNEKLINSKFQSKFIENYNRYLDFQENLQNIDCDPKVKKEFKSRLKENYMFAKYAAKNNEVLEEAYLNIWNGIISLN